ncbi:MAG: hypothetical protein KGD63_02025 [Candidatus Lokiarchaeota archaeon]|nr:hypothetical protein [Candidatus Lokiarchaeota archaeon]
MSIKVAFMQLSSCFGCNVSLLNAQLGLLKILPKLDIVYWPTIIDYKYNSLKKRQKSSIDIGFLEGVARTKKDTYNVKIMREKCKIIVCLGACACYGSVKGLANLFDKNELVNRKFLEAESITNKNPKVPKENLPEFEDFIKNIKEIINVDIFIPGCPPRTENIVSAISYLTEYASKNSNSLNPKSFVCEKCNLFNEGCYLDLNILCYGPITAKGCNLMCPNNGEICYGCYGPVEIPGNKIDLLENIIYDLDLTTKEHIISLQKFLNLYIVNTNINCFYFKEDLIQRLAYEPKSFNTEIIETEKGVKQIFNINTVKNPRINNIIGRSLYLLKDNPNFKFSSKTVCSHCDRNLSDKIPGKLKRDYEDLPNKTQCFIEQGYICLGMVSLAGCGAICPNNANAPCHGCYGPPIGIKDQGAKFISTFGSIAIKKDIDEIMDIIKDPAGTFNRFTLADTILQHKFHDNFKEEDDTSN